jgi:hypothetical protein
MKIKGYTHHCDRQVKVAETGFHESQLTHALKPDAERFDQYAKPGTSAFERQSSQWDTSYPTSRFRSRLP